MDEIINELIDISSSEQIRKFRSHPKKVYKYYLAGILNDILFNRFIHESFFYHQVKFMSLSPEDYPNKDGEGYRKSINMTIDILKSNYFRNPEKDSQIDILINFLRTYLKEFQENNKTLYLISDLEKIISINSYFSSKSLRTPKKHHWIDITFKDIVVPTFPEFFNYQDLINLWNDYVRKYEKIKELKKLGLANQKNPDFRELDYSIKGSERTLIILAINFVESYFYYYFYNIKSELSYPNNKLHKIKGYVQDTQIIEDLLFKEHPNFKNNDSIQNSYEEYKKSLKVRDRFVHTSAFVEPSNKLAELQPLLSLKKDETISILQNSVDFVYLIDSNLPTKEQILFWWNKFETPDFSKESYISPLNIHHS